MAYTVKQAVADVIANIPKCSAPRALYYLNEVHDDLCSEFPIEKSVVTQYVVSGTREYDLDQDVMCVRAAEWYDSAVSHRPLDPTDTDALDVEATGWRFGNSGTPICFYVDGSLLGLEPVPNVTTVGTYPKIVLDCAYRTPLLMSGNLPSSLRSKSVYVNGASAKAAEIHDKAQIELYITLYQRSYESLERYIGTRNRHLIHRVYPDSGYGPGVV